jgi:hypothetical protein
MLHFLQTLDRRWIFLLMAVAVAVPTLMQLKFAETPGQFSQDVYDEVEKLQPGDKVLMAWDYDPTTEGEISPMAKAFAKHCAAKKAKLYFITLLPLGPQMIEKAINEVIRPDYPELVYGEDYVNLGFKSGNEGVIKVIITNLRGLYTTDARGINIDQIPMCRDVKSVQDMRLIVNVSGSYPGTKEWVQYAVTPYQDQLTLVGGCTGVQAPLLFPYIPEQLSGLLVGIKGAAEYEQLVVDHYLTENPHDPRFGDARNRMGPQSIAHLVMIGLILLGNVVFFWERRGK